MGRKKEKPTPFRELIRNLESAHLAWTPVASGHILLPRKFAMSGAILKDYGESPSQRQTVIDGFQKFDKAICNLIEVSKRDIAHPLVMERIKQAEFLGDEKFFKELSTALRNNASFDSRLAKDPAIAIIQHCAWRLLEGDAEETERTYEKYLSFDLNERRSRAGKEAGDHAARARKSIIKNGLENFKARVKRAAEKMKRMSGTARRFSK